MSRLVCVNDKITEIERAIFRINSWKLKQNKIVFTNGCFDILHKGHVTYLAKAADLGDKLIVAVNSDFSLKKLNKGVDRPINKEVDRALLLASLSFVDMVVVFNDDTPLNLISELQPDVLVKGADYDPQETDVNSKKYIVGSDLVKTWNGEVKVIDLEEGYSTTSIINRLKN